MLKHLLKIVAGLRNSCLHISYLIKHWIIIDIEYFQLANTIYYYIIKNLRVSARPEDFISCGIIWGTKTTF